MYKVFGEFDSAEEINQAAAGLLAEEDHKNIKVLAKENGLDEEFAQLYIEGEIPDLTNVTMAAIGKIEIERSGISDNFFNDMKEDMINWLMTQCQDESFARAIRKKGKSLKECFEYCKKKIEETLRKKSGALRDRAVYAMEKDYYFKKEVAKREKKETGNDTDSEE